LGRRTHNRELGAEEVARRVDARSTTEWPTAGERPKRRPARELRSTACPEGILAEVEAAETGRLPPPKELGDRVRLQVVVPQAKLVDVLEMRRPRELGEADPLEDAA
jgi:hypothetical protein